MTKICLYCNREKDESEFSQEHILPRAIGGNLDTYNPFSIDDVCERCNNLCGLFVDAPFAKSWLINNYRSSVAQKYCHLSPTTVLPLAYYGELAELKLGDKICEYWAGPTGDTIYHFHIPYPEDLDAPPMVGRPPTSFKKQIDGGFVLLFIRATNPQWHPAIVYSVISNFKGVTIYLGNGPKPLLPQFQEIPDDLKDLHSKIKLMQGQMHEATVRIGIYAADRFLCKLALGIGSILLNHSFKNSKSADLLRQGMWTKNPEERKKIPIRGTGFVNKKDSLAQLDEFLKWPGGHLLVIMKVGQQLALYSNFYEMNSAVIQITDEEEHWNGRIAEGKVFVIVPPLSRAVGPLDLAELLAHRTVEEYKHPDLLDLEKEMNKFQEHPPYDIK